MGNINGHETRVRAPWLRMRLAEPETAQRICLIDASPAPGEPCLPYARPLDVRALVERHGGVPTSGAFEAAIRTIGTTSLDQVIIYDRDGDIASLVLWGLFRSFGHRDTCILEGGHAAWCAAGGEVTGRYSEHEFGTWRAVEGRPDPELAEAIRRLRERPTGTGSG
jgi:3-mercaptopyruvate sulfurtransferase SseA